MESVDLRSMCSASFEAPERDGSFFLLDSLKIRFCITEKHPLDRFADLSCSLWRDINLSSGSFDVLKRVITLEGIPKQRQSLQTLVGEKELPTERDKYLTVMQH